jgi:hypothetical protein
MSRACSTNVGEEKFIYRIGGKVGMKETFWKTNDG